MDFTNIEHLAALTAILGTAGAAFLFIWKKAIIPFINWVKRITIVFEKVDFIASELKPNGGSSLRDAIDTLRYGLETSVQRQRLIMMDSNTPIFETDADGHCTFANNAYLEMVDRPFEEVAGNGWVIAVHPDDRDEVYQAWVDAIEQNRMFEMNNYRYQTPGKVSTEVFCRATPMRDRHGATFGWIGFVKPLKNKKYTERVVSQA